MGIQLEHYLSAGKGSPFYGEMQPSIGPAAARRRLQVNELPAGWLVNSFGGWEGWTPRAWTPRLQGWKIHLSATPECAEKTLTIATEICTERGVAFKFLPTLAELTNSSGKQASRGGSGKFVTIYPHDDDSFADLVTVLADRLRGQEGPYILSDLRFSDDAPVFVRYGGIAPLEMSNTFDEPVACISDTDSHRFIPDERRPRFNIPDGVELPEVLQEAWGRAQTESVSRLDDFTEIKALHFSNAGGVYRATLPDGSVRVLREARPHAGLDARGRCSRTRQSVEEEVLRELGDLPGVQQLRQAFEAWEHRYLELDFVDGTTLTAWTVSNLRQQENEPERYAARVRQIIADLIDVVERIHQRGWALGDVHGGNILIGPDDSVTVLDLEDATRLTEPREVGFRVFEYCADLDVDAEAADWFGIARTCMLMYVADWELEAVCPDFWDAAKRRIGEVYGEECLAQIEAIEARYPPGTASVLATDDPVGVFDETPGATASVEALMTGIEWSRRYGAGESYPGDVTEPENATVVLASGRAGVEIAKSRVTGDVRPIDLDELEQAAEKWPDRGKPGLLRGLAGVALALHEGGRKDAAINAARRALTMAQGRHRLDWADGLAGAAGVAAEVGDEELRTEALAVFDRADRAIRADESIRDDLDRQRGLFWGASGIAVTHLIAHRFDRDDARLTRARDLIRRDIDSCVRDDTDALMVPDDANGRIMPYVEWGSAGVWLAAIIAERMTGEAVLTAEEVSGFRRACSSNFYIYPGLYHGRAGILTALAAAGPDHRDEVERQSRLLRESLLAREGHAFVIGDGLIRLSSDLSTGASGVALALHGVAVENPFLSLPVTMATAQHWNVGAERAVEPQAAGRTTC